MHMLFRKSIEVLVALSALQGGVAVAQERVNPFVKPPTAAEEQARQDERTRNIIREMQPELKAGIMQDVKASQSALEIDLRRRIDTVAAVAASAPKADKSVIAGDAPISDNKKQEAKAAPAKVPEGAVFISCVNGKALYRAIDKTIFQVQGGNVEGGYNCGQ
jgi:predicted LPLAT superfamily acyltransferase